MPSYADDGFVSLADETVMTSPVSSEGVALNFSSKLAARGRSPMKRDSFSDLTAMMKAKQPYTPPSPRAPLSVASDGVQFASRVSSGSSMLSPLARPYHVNGSVAAYLHEQAHSPTSAVTSPASEYSQQDLQRLDSMLKELRGLSDDDGENNNAAVQLMGSRPAPEPALSGFEPLPAFPVNTGPIMPPTPADSTAPQPQDAVVRVTMHAWNTMGKDLSVLDEKNRALELKIARLEKQKVRPWGSSEEEQLQTMIGRLNYQNEQNKTQKATMARTLSQKDIEIKQLHLNLETSRVALEAAESAAHTYADIVAERDYMQTQLRDDRIRSSCHLADLAEAKNREIENLTQQFDNLQDVVTRAKSESQDDKHKVLSEARLEAFTKCEKQLKSVNAKYAAEHDRANQLDDRVEELQGHLSRVGDLQAELSQKSSECDRWRTKYKNQEKMAEICKLQIERARNENQSLRGAAHLVKPAPTSKLSFLVLGCSECYTKNITCDNKARCRHCTESNEQCSRWRCSLKHRLGQCPAVPCTFPHEEDGWLLAPEPRPQW